MMVSEALVCLQPGSLQIERRVLRGPGPDQALVRPRRVGVCGTDYHIFEGRHPFLKYPRVMGHELAVEVVEVQGGTGLRQGEICVVNPYLSCGRCNACLAGKPNCCVRISVLGVHQDGGMTQFLCVPAANLIAADDLSLDECAAVEFLAIGAHAVRRALPTNRDQILVVGAGPIGLGVALFARLAGASVVLYDRDTERAEVASSIIGADILSDNPDLGQAVAAATNGSGFDVVFDATGNQRAMQNGFDLVAHCGRYVLVGVIRETITFADPDFHRKEMTLLGSRNATGEDFRQVMTALRRGAVSAERLITHRTSLTGAVEDIPHWATEKRGLIKAIIDID
jgi:2-desacetyl-2-hydroxyethyl bacteriochlorophyllide A dehydrogenase